MMVITPEIVLWTLFAVGSIRRQELAVTHAHGMVLSLLLRQEVTKLWQRSSYVYRDTLIQHHRECYHCMHVIVCTNQKKPFTSSLYKFVQFI